MSKAFLLFGCMLIANCALTQHNSVSGYEPPLIVDPHFISLEGLGCSGECVQSVIVFPDGLRIYRYSTYFGFRPIDKSRLSEDRILIEDRVFGDDPSAVFYDLYLSILNAGLENFDEQYDWDTPRASCKTDSQSLVVQVNIPGDRKRVGWDMGCDGFDDHAELVDFFQELERLLEVEDLRARAILRDENRAWVVP